jgi:hypothetical protein
MAPANGKIWAIGVAGALGALYGAWLFTESFIAPKDCCGAAWPGPNPMQAERLLNQQDPKDQNGPAQRAAALTILKARPGDVEAWLRLAYADRLIHGRLTAEGENALDVSYSITPYAGARAVWRTTFVMDNWTTAPDRLKRDAIEEIGIIKSDSTARYELAQRTPSITDANGRAAAALFGVLDVPGVHIQ